jgi:hypothetical protein
MSRETASPRAVGPLESPALSLLRTAREFAREFKNDPWQFAVEIDALQAAGLSRSDLRWLLCRGVLEHREELTRHHDRRRRFRPIRSLALTSTTCFILTKPGWDLSAGTERSDERKVSSIKRSTRIEPGDQTSERPYTVSVAAKTAAVSFSNTSTPVWDARLHQLSIGSEIIRRFTRPARAQELILAALQEEGWPSAIDDPLPAQFVQDPRRRLHYTVFNLNRGQDPLRIRFFINGNGQTVRWRVVPLERANCAPRARQRR